MACAGPVDGAAGDSQGKIGAVSEVNTLAGHVTPTLRDSVGVNASSVPADLFLNDGGVARFEAGASGGAQGQNLESPQPQSKLPPNATRGGSVHYCTHDANAPSEDRHASLVGLSLELPSESGREKARFSLNSFCVLDGHGGSNVAAYASERLLPAVAQALADCLGAELGGGEMKVCGETVDFWRSRFLSVNGGTGGSGNSVGGSGGAGADCGTPSRSPSGRASRRSVHYENDAARREIPLNFDVAAHSSSDFLDQPTGVTAQDLGRFSSSISSAFLKIDRDYINSIDRTNVQRCCKPGGAWNAGTCALVTLVLQKFEGEGSATVAKTPFIVTAHCGDCRAILGTVVPTSCPSSINIPHLSQADDEIKDEDLFGIVNYSMGSKSKKRKLNGNGNGNGNGNAEADVETEGDSGSSSPLRPVSSRTSSASTASTNSRPPSPVTKWSSIELTRDHNCYNESEIKNVRNRCATDPTCVSSPVNGGIKRVAGSLAVTRALGDAYLKTPALSFPPYKFHAPYITAEPEIRFRPILALSGDSNGGSPPALTDKVLVMASDGVWEHASNDAVIEWVQEQRCGLNGNSEDCPAKNVVEGVMDTISMLRKKSRSVLDGLPKGRARRSKHDDITVVVVELDGIVTTVGT